MEWAEKTHSLIISHQGTRRLPMNPFKGPFKEDHREGEEEEEDKREAQ